MNGYYVWTNLVVPKTVSVVLRHINKAFSDLQRTVEPKQDIASIALKFLRLFLIRFGICQQID